MAAGRSLKTLMGRRRRTDEEGEDEEGPVVMEDSQSEGSILSDADDDDADTSSLGGADGVDRAADSSLQTSEAAANGYRAAPKKARKGKRKGVKSKGYASEGSSQPLSSTFKTMADTEAMMNGLKIGDQSTQDVVDFESNERKEQEASTANTEVVNIASTNGQHYLSGDRQRREHEEYRKKRDADPAFVPNRGNFFKHDTRSNSGQGPPVMRGAWSGRGRGRGGGAINAGGPPLPANQMAPVERAAEQTWKHDLHDTINEEQAQPASARPADSPQDRQDSNRVFLGAPGYSNRQQHPRVLSFSSTTLIGKVQIRVSLPGMTAHIAFAEVPWKHYTRLPDHRPPLRRDKPVRVSLPGHTQRYIFPSPDRSFIFIPRQMRPNQQGFGRAGYQRSIGGYGYSSRRTSMYGGSVYAASVAASRRSSFASVARENAFSPVGSYVGGMPPNRPVVRLPHGSVSHFSTTSNTPMGAFSGQQTPTGMQVHTFPLPQPPAYQGTPTTTVHQPRPQKAISVTGIDSPALLQQASSAESQPFQNQLPAHMNEQLANHQQSSQAYYSPRQQFAYPQQPQTGTPLSGIPEQAIHAPSFQPPMMPYGGAPYYAPYPSQQGYYYPPVPNGYQPVPMYVPSPQGYMMSPPAMAVPPPQDAPRQQGSSAAETELPPSQQQSQAQSGMVAHESNGMVFYLPAAEAQQQPQGETYQPAESFVPSYAMPGLPPPTPAPDTAYYYSSHMQAPPYYPPQTRPQ